VASLDKPSVIFVSVTVRDSSVVEEQSPGFTRTEWSVRANDGWMSIAALARRGRAGDISVKVGYEEDPHGEASAGHWVDRPAGCWYLRDTIVTAPVGTHFRKRVWTPVRNSFGLGYPMTEQELVLRPNGSLIRTDVLAERAARRAREKTEPLPLSADEIRRRANSFLAQLGEGPPPRRPR
jgi:hypothetical protein